MRRAATRKAGSLQKIMLITKSRAEAAAQVALNAAYDECRRANFNPFQYLGELTDFVSQAVRDAVKEISVDQKTADPPDVGSVIKWCAFGHKMKTASSVLALTPKAWRRIR